jgi:hypothetical protein
MSTMIEQPPAAAGTLSSAGTFGRLFRSEVHRFRCRRFIQILLALGVLGWLAAVIIGLANFGNPTESDYAQARQEIDRTVSEQAGYRQECLDQSDIPEGVSPDEFCGPEMQASDFRVEDFLHKAPFDLETAGQGGAVGFGAAAAVLAFLIGATWIGAEWSTRSLVALLFWETRRLRVLGAKIAVLAGAAALLGILMQVGWLVMATILRATVGTDTPLPNGFWGELLGTQGRAVLLTVFAALAGFGLANLVRNTGAALGVGFVYFAIVESAVGAFRPTWTPWLLTRNAAALVSPGGLRIPIFDGTFDRNGNPPEVLLTNLHAGLYLAVVLAVIVGVGVALFARRDVH